MNTRRSRRHFASLTPCLLALAAGCQLEHAPTPLGPRPALAGATVAFELERLPQPELPLPNDLATFDDPTSRTGLRVNAAIVSPSSLEEAARRAYAEQEGWGTTMPITVGFERSAGMDPARPALDLDELRRRTFRDEHRFDDDPLYVIDLDTGLPVPLSFGSGELPVDLRDRDLYGVGDPHAEDDNLYFEQREEGLGLSQLDYHPALDHDFDGVLDHPNSWSGLRAESAEARVDDLLTVYERETDTLIVHPLLPLREKHRYAVVLTTRLRGQDGLPVRSPFDGIYHPQQQQTAEQVQAILSQPALAAYYGDLAGQGLDGVTFLWGFTTAPMSEDLRLLRDGLYGHGPFARLARDVPPRARVFPTVGSAAIQPAPPAACAAREQLPYAVNTDDPQFRAGVQKVLETLFNFGAGPIEAIKTSLDATSHVAIGEFDSPYLLGDPKKRTPDARFAVNFRTGEGDVRVDTPQFWASVPKPSGAHKQPYPVVLWAHGVGSNGVEALLYGGDFARHGLATVTVQMPLHGLPDIPLARIFIGAEFNPLCLSKLTDAVLKTRVLDLNGDGDGDVAHWWFTMHAATVRDNLRQAAVDYLQMVRVLRTFDGKTMSGQDYNGDGKEDLAGDFDGDGVPDFGGPDVPLYVGGGSNGGIMAQILGAVGHEFAASVSMSGGGGLSDIAARSYGIAGSVFQALSPLVVAQPASELARGTDNVPKTRCQGTQRSVRMLYSDGPNVKALEVACLAADELHHEQTILVQNTRNGEIRCARTDAEGRFRLGIPSSKNDPLRILVYAGADRVRSYKGCELDGSPELVRLIDTFEQPEVVPGNLRSDLPGCPDDAEQGCTRALETFYPVGSRLRAPQEGFGVPRQSPDLRKLFSLAQGLLDPADPLNYARHHLLDPLPNPDGSPGRPRGHLATGTVGDGFVPISALHRFARAAGILPLLPPSAAQEQPAFADYATPPDMYSALTTTPEQWLLERHVTEGNARLQRHPIEAESCRQNRSDACGGAGRLASNVCRLASFDADWFAEGADRYGAQHELPLRLARRAHAIGQASDEHLRDAWTPWSRSHGAHAPGYRDEHGVGALGHVYVSPNGAHTWLPPDACKAFDDATYGNQLNARYLATGGRDLRYVSHPADHVCLAARTCEF